MLIRQEELESRGLGGGAMLTEWGRPSEDFMVRPFGEYLSGGTPGIRHRPMLPGTVGPVDGFRGRTMARRRPRRAADRIARANQLLSRIWDVEECFRSNVPDEEKGRLVGEYDHLLTEWEALEAEIMGNDQDRAGFRLRDGSWMSLRDALAFATRYREVLDAFDGVVVSRSGGQKSAARSQRSEVRDQ